MKYIGLIILNIIWMLLTILLPLTIFGLFVFIIPDENDDSYWFTYGIKLLNGLLDNDT